MANRYHVVPNGNQWCVRLENSARASGCYDTQTAAIELGL